MLYISESSSAGRAQPCQGWGRGFESRLSLFLVVEFRRRTQVVRDRSAKPLCAGSNPAVASMESNYFVYVLRSKKDRRRYIGYTSNLDRRLREHQAGLVTSTRNRRPLELIYSETFSDKKIAQAREHFFKTGKGRQFLNTLGV